METQAEPQHGVGRNGAPANGGRHAAPPPEHGGGEEPAIKLEIPTYSEHILSEFAQKERNKAMGLLRKQFPSLSDMDCEDILQESFIVLYQNNRVGKLRDMTSSLSTYFISICRNKAHEKLRQNGRAVGVADDADLDFLGEVKDDKLQSLLTLDDETSLIEAKEALARQIVQDLPHPCQELLWGFYRDNCSMKTLADLIGSTVGSVKVTKHRCQEKFRKRWTELVERLYNGENDTLYIY